MQVHLDRYRVVPLAVLLTLLGIAAPLLICISLAHKWALADEEQRLQKLAQLALQRAELAFADARGVLQQLNTLDVEPCSLTHVGLMRRLALMSSGIDDISFYQGDQLACTTTGPVATAVARGRAELTTADGIGLSLNIVPKGRYGVSMVSMVGMAQGHYKLFIRPMRFADVLAEPDVHLAITLSDGRLLGSLRSELPEHVLTNIASGISEQSLLHAVAHNDFLRATAAKLRPSWLELLRREMPLLVLLACAITALVVALVVWGLGQKYSLLGALKLALVRNELLVYYQPLIELSTGRCVGAEALLRWRRADGRMVRPDLFVELAEAHGMIFSLTDQVIAAVVREMRDVLVSNRDLHIAINLCAEDISSGRVLDVLEQSLKGSGIAPQQIWLEATERGLLDTEAARHTIARARERGYG
ncbi:MAG TPA: EAL domain-containing protein, partial [Comamonas sp.]